MANDNRIEKLMKQLNEFSNLLYHEKHDKSKWFIEILKIEEEIESLKGN